MNSFISMNKRGQFYLIAAVAIIALIAGLGTVYNSVSSSGEDSQINFVFNEINYETAKIIDNAVYTNLPKSDLSLRLSNFLKVYADEHPNLEIIFVYGSREDLNLNQVINIYYPLENPRVLQTSVLSVSGDILTISPNSIDNYESKIKEQNLYLILKLTEDHGTYVKTNIN